ncbi:exodeoxyribonuclease VII large subunit [Fodinisporobacter ferrooxydans]|uniref:Exodeoxyribonuclease 7 large subunit n=1 Tax=Fodinisporobacter ferrooxydans TaxID=2901836 RepID=A0ABY4CIH2_9BACL|nr:exodeoxyribonuclease VII large subunit [Alicyclobacillaceae bacterium MYW30-H2]
MVSGFMAKTSIETILSIGELNLYVKRLMQTDPVLANVWVRGEISNFTHHSRGHMYFTLKDDQSRIRAVMFAGKNRNLMFLPKDGTKVIARGFVDVYERDGQYQFYVEEMQPDGIGALHLAFQQLKERLEKEGLFAQERKRMLPVFPKVVGVITSPTGAAVRDIITTIQRRCPAVHVLLHPVLVQGRDAAPSVAKAIETMNQLGEADVLIVGRGGGSLEELWAFNEEIVARAIYQSRIPVISAVGHETDFTIADFAADVRAATPTAAAELAVPHLSDLLRHVDQLRDRLSATLHGMVKERRKHFERLAASSVFIRPAHTLLEKKQYVDHLENQLELVLTQLAKRLNRRLSDATQTLTACDPKHRIAKASGETRLLQQRLVKAVQERYHTGERNFERLLDKLEMLNPLHAMRRGFSLTFKDRKATQMVKSLRDVQPGDIVHVRLQDGMLDCQVWGMEEIDDDETSGKNGEYGGQSRSQSRPTSRSGNNV